MKNVVFCENDRMKKESSKPRGTGNNNNNNTKKMVETAVQTFVWVETAKVRVSD